LLLTLQQKAGLTDSAVHIFVTRQAVQHGPLDPTTPTSTPPPARE
jgi:hypothetical protein